MTPFEQEQLKKFRENFTYASFCWNGDMITGKRFAQNTKKDIESFFLSSLQEQAEAIIAELESNPNEDGSISPNIQHWIEQKQLQLKKKFL